MKPEQKEKLITLLREALLILEIGQETVVKEGFVVCPTCNRQGRGDTCWNCQSALPKQEKK